MKISRSDHKLALRQQAKVKVHGHSTTAAGRRQHAESIESGRERLLVISSEGGDSRAKKAKNELTYLLNNYLPRYDARIEMLIDQWRTSGDPAYDPGVRSRLRQARKNHMTKSNPI